MKKQFVRTENDKGFRAALKEIDQRGASERALLAVYGRAGDGKTHTLHNWASGCNAVVLTAYPGWTLRQMMVELATKLGVAVNGAWEKTLAARIAAEEVPIVLDEAGFTLTDTAACVERLRAITDKSGTLLVLVLMEEQLDRLHRHAQLMSRATLCRFGPSTLADVKAACDQLAEVPIADDLVEHIHAETAGRMRLVIEAINSAERLGQARALPVVRRADIGKIALFQKINGEELAKEARAARRAA